MVLWRGVFAHKDTPEPILNKLEETFTKVATSESFKDLMNKAGHSPTNLVGRVKLQEFLEEEDKILKQILTEHKLIEK